MIVRRPNATDWGKFISLSEAENWRVPSYELALLQGPWSEYAYVLDVDGFCGLVTAVAYEKSAWIGNLIIPFEHRGKGYGTYFFKSVLADLVDKELTLVWLTASEQGRSIYEREGFTVVDTVERWVLPPQPEIFGKKEMSPHTVESLLSADSLAWGESRCSLLEELCKTGAVFSVDGAVALLQQHQDCQVIGPCYSYEASLSANHELLRMVVASQDPSREVVVDCLASSRVQPLFKDIGFQNRGQSSLMVYGDMSAVNLNNIVSLASLGSIG